jgi:hypothetical protein
MQRFPGMRAFAVLTLLGVAAFSSPATRHFVTSHRNMNDDRAFPAAPVASASPFVDVHTHLDAADVEHSIQSALQAMADENAARIVFMPPPFTTDDSARYDAGVLLPAVHAHPDKLAVLGGGETLNAMIHESARSGRAGLKTRLRFRRQAAQLLSAGAVGFGEIAAEHFQGATPYQSVPPDHPLLLLLADIAADHGVPIDLHMEAVPQDMPLPQGLKSPPNPPQLRANIAAFERLLKHNRRAQIIWAHAGSDNTGYRTPELCRRLLKAHPNLYMDVKVDPMNPGKNSPLADGGSGKIKPEWLQLFQDFPDRFVIGTDQHYPEPAAASQRWQAAVLLLNQLPADLRKKIGMVNATRLYFARLYSAQ